MTLGSDKVQDQQSMGTAIFRAGLTALSAVYVAACFRDKVIPKFARIILQASTATLMAAWDASCGFHPLHNVAAHEQLCKASPYWHQEKLKETGQTCCFVSACGKK